MITDTATAAPWPMGPPRMGSKTFAQGADPDGGHGDADLAGRDVVADVLELGQGQPRAALALVGHLLQARLARAHERVLRDHKERVDQDQDPGQDDEERGHRPSRVARTIRLAPCPGALLLRGRSSSFIQRRVQR
jgi:hypothetical protein